jgi:hypothetical protein
MEVIRRYRDANVTSGSSYIFYVEYAPAVIMMLTTQTRTDDFYWIRHNRSVSAYLRVDHQGIAKTRAAGGTTLRNA